MSKVVLVLDNIPESCCDCPCYDFSNFAPCCKASNMFFKLEDSYDITYKRQNWCPLKTLKKLEYTSDVVGEWSRGYQVGYNNCINDILNNEN